jgi:hypothetical protein
MYVTDSLPSTLTSGDGTAASRESLSLSYCILPYTMRVAKVSPRLVTDSGHQILKFLLFESMSLSSSSANNGDKHRVEVDLKVKETLPFLPFSGATLNAGRR